MNRKSHHNAKTPILQLTTGNNYRQGAL